MLGHARSFVVLSFLLHAPITLSLDKLPTNAMCDPTSVESLIVYAHSIKKFTEMCVPDGFPKCHDVGCLGMVRTFESDPCHEHVLKCAGDMNCEWHNQATPYLHFIGGTLRTCESCIGNPKDAVTLLEEHSKYAAAVCEFENIAEPQVHAGCQTRACHTAMKHINLKCLTAWVAGFAWLPSQEDVHRRTSAYAKASLRCDPGPEDRPASFSSAEVSHTSTPVVAPSADVSTPATLAPIVSTAEEATHTASQLEATNSPQWSGSAGSSAIALWLVTCSLTSMAFLVL